MYWLLSLVWTEIISSQITYSCWDCILTSLYSLVFKKHSRNNKSCWVLWASRLILLAWHEKNSSMEHEKQTFLLTLYDSMQLLVQQLPVRATNTSEMCICISDWLIFESVRFLFIKILMSQVQFRRRTSHEPNQIRI